MYFSLLLTISACKGALWLLKDGQHPQATALLMKIAAWLVVAA
jgi:hypothetical protein